MLRSAALAVCLLAGCVTTRGPFARAEPVAIPGGVSLVLLGEAGVVGRSGEPTAAAVGGLLADDAPAVVVLLGGQAAHRVDARGRPRAVRAHAPVTAAARAHGSVISITGAAERLAKGATSGSAVLRIDHAGRVRTVSRCEARTCTLDTNDATDDVLELVVLDLAAWRTAAIGNDDPLARIEGLLDAVTDAGSAVPRVLVLELPLEGGLEHGLGALGGPTATFHNLPPRLQRAVQDGVFVGVIAGGEAGVHATHNVGRAIQRTDKTWLRSPVWQVVSGRAAGPVAGHGAWWRHTALARGVGFRPELATLARGFAVLNVGGRDDATLDVYARRRRAWWRARVQLPLAVTPASGPRDTPSMLPCMRCDEVPPGERR